MTSTARTDNPTPVPDPETLRQRARQLAPELESQSHACNDRRDLSDDIVDRMRAGDLFRILQPRRWGGFEMDPRVLFDIQNIFARACASSAWVYGVLSVQSFVVSLFDTRAQEDVWGGDGRTLVSSSFQPVGKVEKTDEGFLISGRWSFSSGSSHADWALLGGMVPPDDAKGSPAMTLFLVPKSDYRIEENWDTFGLRGTGSNDIVADKAFVPRYRSHQPAPGIVPIVGDAPDLPPFYRLPWLYLFTSSISNLGIGAARGALDKFLSVERERVSSTTGRVAREDPRVHEIAARTAAEIETSEAMYKRHIQRFMDCIERQAPLPMSEGMCYRTQLTSVIRKLAGLVDEMQVLLGGRGVHFDSPLTRVWLDLLAARAHPGNDPANIAPGFGKLLLETPAGE
jgi:3-hydroxy-9,10-secoandrosta-1,3,5(10)-triene-9,17-dione monooxygenase